MKGVDSDKKNYSSIAIFPMLRKKNNATQEEKYQQCCERGRMR
jgi:hypothetical protein